MASRLTEDPDIRVLLIEAGGSLVISISLARMLVCSIDCSRPNVYA